MGQTYKADFEVDNGTDYDKYNFSTSADQVSYTKNGKETNVQTELDALNTGINYRDIGKATFASGWTGNVSCGYITPHVGMIWGSIVKESSGAATWGEQVLSISGLSHTYYQALSCFETRDGTNISAFVLTPNGAVRTYSPDIDKVTPNKIYHIRGLFYIN